MTKTTTNAAADLAAALRACTGATTVTVTDGATIGRSTGRCRYCGDPRPAGYSVTCAGSYCQEAAYRDAERRPTRRTRRRHQ